MKRAPMKGVNRDAREGIVSSISRAAASNRTVEFSPQHHDTLHRDSRHLTLVIIMLLLQEDCDRRNIIRGVWLLCYCAPNSSSRLRLLQIERVEAFGEPP